MPAGISMLAFLFMMTEYLGEQVAKLTVAVSPFSIFFNMRRDYAASKVPFPIPWNYCNLFDDGVGLSFSSACLGGKY